MPRQVPNITSIEESAEEERRHRTRQYLITMAIRTACLLLMVFVRGPWLWVCAAGAIFLPLIAVMYANHARQRRLVPIERPEAGAVEVRRDPVSADAWYRAADADEDAEPSAPGESGEREER
ncbi:DUF3099 domain-containing protein [Gulosibacter sp. 10]|uniref:DUF3099 domain-containing protein n=1 Tax=Gulosibacter sp. 10 TaxID=1255570 RepID=UPI000B362223|nr:DUF3099 domain-containing protein [Gulosibacter sp. 10]